jgi:type VI secretion system protein ImpA
MENIDQTVSEKRVIEVESLLRPIDDESPAGRDLADSDEYQTIREHRRADIEIVFQDDEFDKNRRLFRKPEQKSSDWHAVVKLGSDALRAKTKDLQIAAWVAEALGQLYGFAGVRDGFHLLYQLQERFWEDIFPRLEPDDPESRFGPYEFLNSDKVLPSLIRSLPLTKGGGGESYSHLDFASLLANDDLLRKKPDIARQGLRGPNKIVSEDWDRVVAQTPRSFYEARHSELTECLETFTAWEESTVQRFPRGTRGKSSAPSLSNIRQAIVACRDVVADILPVKRALEPAAPHASDEVREERSVAAVDGNGKVDGPVTETSVLAPPLLAAKPPESVVPPIADRATAYRRLIEVVEFLREDHPASPIAYLLIRAYRMGEVYASAGLPPDGERPGPASEVRQELRRAVADDRWEEALKAAERALGRPEGRCWLDAHRYAIHALEATDRQSAAAGCRSLLRMFLHDFPGLLETELDDGTASADAKTRNWLERQGLLDQGASRTEPVPPPLPEPGPVARPTAAPDGAPVEITAQAVALADAGRVQEAVMVLDQAMAAATNGRDRFLIELHLAEICQRLKNDQLALALLEDLERKIDTFHLEDWENRELCARVFGSLYNCLKARGVSERLQQVYARLCKLDVRRAIQSGPVAASS